MGTSAWRALPVGLVLCLAGQTLAVTVSGASAPATVRPGETIRVTWSTNSATRINHTNVHWGSAPGNYTSTTTARFATGAGVRNWSATFTAPAQAGTVYIVVHARESSGAEVVSAELQCVVTTVTPTTPTAGAFESATGRLHADVDRDGAIGASDDAGRDQWTTARGAVIAYNNDDDDGDLRLDSADAIVNGTNDLRTMARVVVARVTSAPARVGLSFQPTDAPIRVFRRVGNGYSQVLAPGQASGTIPTAEAAAAAIELRVEATGARSSSWDGFVTLTLDVQGPQTGRDSIKLRCAPLIYVDNTRPAERVYAMKLDSPFDSNLLFWDALERGLASQGVPLYEVRADRYGSDRWVQDGMQLGYQGYLGANGHAWIDDFNQLERGRGLGNLIPRELLGPNRGMAYGGRGQNESVNYGGNLEVVPPHSAGGRDYPFGRIYVGGGSSSVLGAPMTRHMNREELALLNAQQVQAPVIEISSEWLAVGHVDEFSQAIPDRVATNGRPWKMAWASPALARRALRDLQGRGLGSARVFAGRRAETTVDRILRDTALMRFNDAVQARLDSNKQRLMSACGLTSDDFVEMPMMFEDIGFDGDDQGAALNPGVANCITVNDTLYVPDPEGPREGGLDVWQEQVRSATQRLGLRVVFVDVFESYHENLGEAHCGSNVRLRPYDAPWWTR